MTLPPAWVAVAFDGSGNFGADTGATRRGTEASAIEKLQRVSRSSYQLASVASGCIAIATTRYVDRRQRTTFTQAFTSAGRSSAAARENVLAYCEHEKGGGSCEIRHALCAKEVEEQVQRYDRKNMPVNSPARICGSIRATYLQTLPTRICGSIRPTPRSTRRCRNRDDGQRGAGPLTGIERGSKRLVGDLAAGLGSKRYGLHHADGAGDIRSENAVDRAGIDAGVPSAGVAIRDGNHGSSRPPRRSSDRWNRRGRASARRKPNSQPGPACKAIPLPVS